jgi:hypothetical protein
MFFRAVAGSQPSGSVQSVVLDDDFAVHLHGNGAALDDDVLGPPLSIFGGGKPYAGDVVDTARLLPVGLGVVHLRLETALGPAGVLKLGVKVYAPVGAGLGHDFDLEFKIFEGRGVAGVEQMAAWPARDEGAVLDFPSAGILGGRGPTGEGLAVGQGDEALIGVGGQAGGGGEDKGQGEAKDGVGHALD